MKIPQPEEGVHYRSGAAARMANIPVTTLRVWERRYEVVAPPKTGSGQRLYRPEDVHRLVLLKGLVDSGCAIGTIARLATGQLETMTAELPASTRAAAPESAQGEVVRLGVVGQGLLARVDSWLLRRPKTAPQMALGCRYPDIAQAALGPVPKAGIHLLAVQINSLRPEDARAILALMGNWRCKRVVVLYGFGTLDAVQTLQSFGVAVRQGPLIGLDLESLLDAGQGAPAPIWAVPGNLAPPRYSAEVLEKVADLPTSISCECPRHIVAMLGQLMAFEKYSAECLSQSEDDAALHFNLHQTAGIARQLFERALETLAASHGFTDQLGSPAAATGD